MCHFEFVCTAFVSLHQSPGCLRFTPLWTVVRISSKSLLRFLEVNIVDKCVHQGYGLLVFKVLKAGC